MRYIWASVFWLVLAGCQAQSAPVASVLPTPSPTPASAQAGNVRYGVSPSLRALGLNLDEQAQTGLVIETDALDGDFDVVITLGALANAETAPQPLQIVLLVNDMLPPVQTAQQVTLLETLFSADVLEALAPFADARINAPLANEARATREQLATWGFLDGWRLVLAYTPFTDLTPLLQASIARNVRWTLRPIPTERLREVIAERQAHAIFTAWINTPDTLSLRVIPLAQIPISYRAKDPSTLQWGVNGLPIVRFAR